MEIPTSIAGVPFNAFLVVVAALAIVAEVMCLRLWRRRVDLNDTAESMGIGLLWVGFRLVIAKGLAFGVWVWTWQNLAIFEIDLGDPLAWIGYWLLGDLIYYWTHRLEHRVRALWCSHLVHHTSEEFNLATAVRQPWTEAFYKPAIALWAPLLGFHPAMYVFVGTISLAVGQWQHLGWFPRVWVLDMFVMSPSNHRVHHARNREYLDRNFGGSLVVWDKVFGTYAAETKTPEYGVLHYDPPVSIWAKSLGGFPQLFADMRRGSLARAARLALGRPASCGSAPARRVTVADSAP
ncbi:MAG: sterol desaturase family protein [Acidimicrobiales bacterium]